MSKPSTHLAAIVPEAHSKLVIQERKTPTPAEGEILIQNHAIALNPLDNRRVDWGLFMDSYPVILGQDLAGVVVEVGPGVSNFKPGDRVIAFTPAVVTGNNDHAAFQQYTITPAINTSKIPDSLEFVDAVTVVCGISTVITAYDDVLKVRKPGSGPAATDSAVLIWGGASSVGKYAIELARLSGLPVITTASPRHHDSLRALGASAVFDYSSPAAVTDLIAAAEKLGKPLDLAIDAISMPDTLPQVVEVLSKTPGSGAKIIAHTLPWPDSVPQPPRGMEHHHITAKVLWEHRSELAAWLNGGTLTAWLEEGKVKPLKVRLFEGGLQNAQKAMDSLAEGVSSEKVVLKLL